MKPEQRVAAYVTKKYALSVPVDVEAFARTLADIEEDVLPVRSDAVVITNGLTRPRPLIILNSATPPTRRRFTLAHEIGHLLIPWHMGTFTCHTTGGVRLGDDLYVAVEAESNRFAAELLLPSEWLKNVVGSGMSPNHILKFVRKAANVSSIAATLAICQALPPGYLFAITNAVGFVQIAAASPGSTVSAPPKGESLDIAAYSKHATLYEVSPCAGEQIVHWWRYVGITASRSIETDARSSGEILKAIIEAAVSTPQQALAVSRSINGIVGAANSSRKPQTADELLGILYETFTVRPTLAAITSHPDFDVFLVKRASEIVLRRPMTN